MFRITLVAALALAGISCHSGPPPAIDPALAAMVPPDATVFGGAKLDRLRRSAAYRQFPPPAKAMLDSFAVARSVLFSSDGQRYLILVRGDFPPSPSGTTLLAKGVAGAGSPEWLSAAVHRRGGPPALLGPAEAVAGTSDIWIAVLGSANLPLTGNGQNLHNLLRATRYTTVGIQVTEQVTISVLGTCSGAEPARHLEEALRAMVSLGAGATVRQPALSGLLRRVRVARTGTVVRVDSAVQPAELPALWRLLGMGS